MNPKTVYHSLIIFIVVALLLLVPLVAMQFSDEVNWSPFDFVVAFVLLMGTGLTFEFITRKSADTIYKFAVASALGTALLMIWTNLAVGIIGSENNPANQMYFGVLAIAVIGSAITRLRAYGMANVLLSTAAANVLAAVTAIAAGWGAPYNTAMEILFINLIFILLWIISAILFSISATKKQKKAE